MIIVLSVLPDFREVGANRRKVARSCSDVRKTQEGWFIDPTPCTPEDYETLVDLLYDQYPAEMGANDRGSKALLRALQQIAEQSVECTVWTKQEANGNLIVIEWGGHPKYILATLDTLTGVYNPGSAEWDELIEQANDVFQSMR